MDCGDAVRGRVALVCGLGCHAGLNVVASGPFIASLASAHRGLEARFITNTNRDYDQLIVDFR
jgi:hypothetical protein